MAKSVEDSSDRSSDGRRFESQWEYFFLKCPRTLRNVFVFFHPQYRHKIFSLHLKHIFPIGKLYAYLTKNLISVFLTF